MRTGPIQGRPAGIPPPSATHGAKPARRVVGLEPQGPKPRRNAVGGGPLRGAWRQSPSSRSSSPSPCSWVHRPRQRGSSASCARSWPSASWPCCLIRHRIVDAADKHLRRRPLDG